MNLSLSDVLSWYAFHSVWNALTAVALFAGEDFGAIVEAGYGLTLGTRRGS